MLTEEENELELLLAELKLKLLLELKLKLDALLELLLQALGWMSHGRGRQGLHHRPAPETRPSSAATSSRIMLLPSLRPRRHPAPAAPQYHPARPRSSAGRRNTVQLWGTPPGGQSLGQMTAARLTLSSSEGT
ncbi:MAG TPA: hypothetical protein VGD66_00070 [Allosphingosinicella sp.]|jgi:hypothetical protein